MENKSDIMTSTQAWNYATGMIKVDGLEPTKEFKEYIEKENNYGISIYFFINILLFYRRIIC